MSRIFFVAVIQLCVIVVDQHFHNMINSNGAFLLPTMDDLAFIEKHLIEMQEARMYPGDLPDELKWENMLHCGGNMVRTFVPESE